MPWCICGCHFDMTDGGLPQDRQWQHHAYPRADGIEAPEGTPGWELIELAGRKRGYLISGGEVNTERMSKVLLDEFRGGKLGKFTLEMPEGLE